MLVFARRSALSLAVLASAAMTAPLAAQSASYRATLATPAQPAKKAVAGGLLWRCEGDSCVAPIDGSRPVIACAKMVREFGAVTRFAHPKGELGAEDLARCNAAAN
jgi:hypothetical protein